MPSSVARLVGLDHDRLVRLLRRACSAGPNQERWRSEFVALLRAHRVAEQEALLTEASRTSGLEEQSSRQDAADRDLDELADVVAAAPIGTSDFADLCSKAQHVVTAHGDALRTTVLDTLSGSVGRKEMRRLGGRYESRRDQELADSHGQRTPPRRLDLSRAELYELAKRAGIEGRSGMSRGELIDELQRRQHH
jgi:hypothetical protein